MNLRDSLRHIRRYFHGCNWKSDEYSQEKAFVCSVFSNLAYAHISEIEFGNTRNVNLIPSEEYERRILNYLRTRERIDVNSLLAEAELPQDGFVIFGQAVVVSVVIIREIVFVSLRGTEMLNIHDWRNNLNAMKASENNPGDSTARFHRGFFNEVFSFKNGLECEILRQYGTDIKVYVTGHSLGGALAAVLFSLWNGNNIMDLSRRIRVEPAAGFNVVSAYTYGMPRYANHAAIFHYPNPYHILNKQDIVPRLPPKLLGYEDCLNEIPLDDAIDYEINNNSFFGRVKQIGYILTLKKLHHHSIETYTGRIYRELEAAGKGN